MCTFRNYEGTPLPGRCGGLIASGSSGPGSSSGRGRCVVFLSKTLCSHSTPLRPGVQMSTGEFNAGANPAMDYHPIQGEIEILLVASCYRNRDKLQSDGLLSSYADLKLPYLTIALVHACRQMSSTLNPPNLFVS